jgi:hypothetical protein
MSFTGEEQELIEVRCAINEFLKQGKIITEGRIEVDGTTIAKEPIM